MAVGADTVWRVRTGGNNVNGGGYDATISGAGTDYSQQDAAQLSGSVGTAAGTTTFTDATATFTSAMIGNALYIASGVGFTAGAYFIINRASNTSITLDRSPGTGSAAVWKVGGAWADPFTRFAASTSAVVPGNIIYVRGGGTQYPTVDDYATTGDINLVQGSSAGVIRMIGENGCPRIASNGLIYQEISAFYFESIYFSANGATNGKMLISDRNGYTNFVLNCTLDRNGNDISATSDGSWSMWQSEIVDTAAGSGTSPGVDVGSFGNVFGFNNIHDIPADGIASSSQNLGTHVYGNIIAKCGGSAISLTGVPDAEEGTGNSIWANTIDGNGDGGITFNSTGQASVWTIGNNLITNHTTGSAVGITSVGSTAANDRGKGWTNWNGFYGNTANVSNFTLSYELMVNNITGTNPGYQAQSTEGYRPGTALRSAGYPGSAFPNNTAGTSPPRSYVTPGAVQRIVPAVSTARAPRPVMIVY